MKPNDLAVAILALLGVVALILLARRAALRLPGLTSGAARAGPLQVEQTLALDARRRLLLVRCGARQLLLLTGGSQDIVVGWLDAPSDQPEAMP
jgi:flagellar protein FliO/FliZ